MSDCGDVWYESDARFPPPKIVGRLVPIERAEKAEAAIKRVREMCDAADSFTPPLVLTSAELRRALDVPCPTCSGPIRETVGLVCQTCGTYYGDSDE